MPKRGRTDVKSLREKVGALTDQVRALEATVHNLQRCALEIISERAKRARGEKEASVEYCQRYLMSLLTEEEERYPKSDSNTEGEAGDLVPIGVIMGDDNFNPL